MALNPFHPDSLDPIGKAITILKGDLPGHAFHGNQYADATACANGAAGIAMDSERYVPNQDFVDKHDALASAHLALADMEEQRGNQEVADAHRDAAYAHEAAASANAEAIGASVDGTDEKAIAAERETKNAAEESQRVARLATSKR